MGYAPRLLYRVEGTELDAEAPPVFWFRSPDEAFARIVSLITRDRSLAEALAQASGAESETIGLRLLGSPMVSALLDLFGEGLVRWEGVLGEDGAPLPCTRENVAMLPTWDRLLTAARFACELFEATNRGNGRSGSATKLPGRATNRAGRSRKHTTAR